jgi:hypothetical protein
MPPARSAFLAGSLPTFSLADVFGHVVAGIRTGKLVVTNGPALRTVNLSDGQIVFATSTERHERLGNALVRLGLLTDEQLNQALLQVGPRARLGQVLTRMGLISAANLYSGMTFLVREIVVNLFELSEGEFLFLDGEITQDALKLPERTKLMILEGMKRGDEVIRLRNRLPETLRVRLASGGAPRTSDVLSAQVALGASLAELRPRFEGSEHAFLTWVEEQLRSGEWIEAETERLPPPSPVPSFAGRSVLELYGDLVSAVCGALRGANEDLGQLRAFLEGPPTELEPIFSGVTLSEDGALDMERLISNAGGKSEPRARARTYEALDSFVAYALFAAHNVLAPQVAEQLAQTFRRMREGR